MHVHLRLCACVVLLHGVCVSLGSCTCRFSEFDVQSTIRFRKEDISGLVDLLELPTWIVTNKRERFHATEALVIFLARLASSDKWERHLSWLGGRDRASYGRCFNMVLRHVYDRFACRLSGLDQWHDQAEYWAYKAREKGSPAPRVVGFIDGTLRDICRPKVGQRMFYNGHKKKHGIKFQTVQSVCGLIVDYYGPMLGKHGDGRMYSASGIEARVHNMCVRSGGIWYIYGDPAYKLSRYVLRGFRGGASSAQRRFSTDMSRIRESVEWGYAGVVALWPLIDFKSRMKKNEVPVGKLAAVACFMYNMHACFYGNQISHYFDCPPPSAREYVHRVRNTPTIDLF